MQRSALKLLEDIHAAAEAIQDFTRGLDVAAYGQSLMARSAVERQFEIIGEAMRRLTQRHPDVARRISEVQQIVGFRNVLIHGYDIVDRNVVWNTVVRDIPALLREVRTLLDEEEARS